MKAEIEQLFTKMLAKKYPSFANDFTVVLKPKAVDMDSEYIKNMFLQCDAIFFSSRTKDLIDLKLYYPTKNLAEILKDDDIYDELVEMFNQTPLGMSLPELCEAVQDTRKRRYIVKGKAMSRKELKMAYMVCMGKIYRAGKQMIVKNDIKIPSNWGNYANQITNLPKLGDQ